MAEIETAEATVVAAIVDRDETKSIRVGIQASPGFEPHFASDGAAGADLRADVPQPLILAPGTWMAVPTGVVMDIPRGFEGQVRPRSGLAVHHGVTVLNSPGTIDSDYRGEVRVPLINHGNEPFVVEPGMRIAQIVIAPVAPVVFEQRDGLSSTARGEKGFGSTGHG